MKRLVDANSRNWDKATCPTRGELLLFKKKKEFHMF